MFIVVDRLWKMGGPQCQSWHVKLINSNNCIAWDLTPISNWSLFFLCCSSLACASQVTGSARPALCHTTLPLGPNVQELWPSLLVHGHFQLSPNTSHHTLINHKKMTQMHVIHHFQVLSRYQNLSGTCLQACYSSQLGIPILNNRLARHQMVLEKRM